MSVVKFKVIQFNNGCFITNTENLYVGHSDNLANLFFDGVKAEPSCKKDWYKLDKLPTTISKLGYVTRTNYRYELKDTVTFNLPKVYNRDEFARLNEEGDWVARSAFEDVFSLYKEVYDIVPAQLEKVKFYLDVIAKYNCDLIEPNDISSFSYSCFIDGSFNRTITKDNTTKITHCNVEYLLVNELTIPNLYIDNTPCCLSVKASYNIIRFYIKQNIDNTWATLTDYDFCLTVEKNINLQETETYHLLENVFSKSKKKPKSITKYRNKRKVTIYECCPSLRDGYTVVTPFKGNNLQDLKNNIDTYLTNLITEINKPLIDCPHCKGLGVIDFVNTTN
jgi:hypothetical protein